MVPPVDPNNQDTSVLIGSEDISKLDRYTEGDPRVLELNGAFNVGNRGMVEFIEVFKNETEYLHTMITATQEKFVPAPGRHGTIYVDTCIVAHSNEAEWQKFKADHTNEAILDRIVVVKVPYNLRLSEEVKIYRKFLDRSKFNAQIAPHTLEVASMFAILSRLDPSPKCDLMTKLKIYNGEEVLEKGRPKKLTVHELREDAKREGLFGISTRFIMKALDTALTRNNGSIHPINVREALIGMVKEADTADDTKKQYLEFLQDALHKVYLEMLEKDITKAFVYSFQGQAETLFHNYLDHAEAYVTKTKVKDPVDPGRDAARRRLPEIDRGADRDHRAGGRRLPSGSDRLSVGGDAARREDRLRLLRAAQGGDREEADELGARHQPDHHQGPHAGRRAAAEIRLDGREPDRAGLQRGQHRHDLEVRVQPSVEGLTLAPHEHRLSALLGVRGAAVGPQRR